MSLPALQSLGPLANMKTSGTSCCNKVDMTPYRVTFENALRSLTEDQKLKMKTLLKADQVCYFVKNNRGQIEQKNF